CAIGAAGWWTYAAKIGCRGTRSSWPPSPPAAAGGSTERSSCSRTGGPSASGTSPTCSAMPRTHVGPRQSEEEWLGADSRRPGPPAHRSPAGRRSIGTAIVVVLLAALAGWSPPPAHAGPWAVDWRRDTPFVPGGDALAHDVAVQPDGMQV